MVLGGSLSRSKEPTTGLYSETHKLVHSRICYFFNGVSSSIPCPSMSTSLNSSRPFKLSTKILYAFHILSTCATYLNDLILFDLEVGHPVM
jgi:hypothetical protein